MDGTNVKTRFEKDESRSVSGKITSANGLQNTPHTTTGITPAELLLGRKPKTLLDLATPNIAEKVRRKQSEQKQQHDNKARNRSFSTQQDGYVRNFGAGPQWIR